MYRYFKIVAGVDTANYIYFWKSKGLSDERVNSISASNHSITPEIDYCGSKIRVKFSGKQDKAKINKFCLKQDKATYSHGTIVNICIVYK